MKIKELKIYTPNLDAQIEFYSDVIGLEIQSQSDNSVSFIVGASILTLEYRQGFTPYHFAFNIPFNKMDDALEWLKQRVEILKDGQSEIQYFDFWDARAVYFYDKDNNIVEFIARKKLGKKSDVDFDQYSILEISEIGVPSFDLVRDFEVLSLKTGVEVHSGSLEGFCAVGSENGLFILINKEFKKKWFPTDDQPFSSDFFLRFIEQGNEFDLKYSNENFYF